MAKQRKIGLSRWFLSQSYESRHAIICLAPGRFDRVQRFTERGAGEAVQRGPLTGEVECPARVDQALARLQCGGGTGGFQLVERPEGRGAGGGRPVVVGVDRV